MKNRIFPGHLWAIVGMALLVHFDTLRAQDSTPSATNPEITATASSQDIKPVQLSEGVSEILMLVRKHINDDIIISFIENSRKSYNLTAKEIIYLREEKVSDRVLTAMMHQPNKAAHAPVTPSQPTAPAAPEPTSVDNSIAVGSSSVQPVARYVQPPLSYVPSSPAYISPGYVDYGYPYYGGYYYGGYFPPVALSFGFGRGFGRGFRGGGGFHGGFRGGGGFHGGGHR